MKLMQRVHLILPPVIAVIFLTTFWVNDSSNKGHAIDNIEMALNEELTDIGNKVIYEEIQGKNIFYQLVSNDAYTHFDSVQSTPEQVPLLKGFMDAIRSHSNNLFSHLNGIYIYNDVGTLLLSSEDTPNNRLSQRPDITDSVRQMNIPDSDEAVKYTSFLYFSDINGWNFAHITKDTRLDQPLSGSQSSLHDKPRYILTTSDVNNLVTGSSTLIEHFAPFFDVNLTAKSASSNVDVPLDIDISEESGIFLGALSHPLFDIQVKLNADLLKETLQGQRERALITTVLLILFSYFTIIVLIRKQILEPIRVLTHQVLANDSKALEPIGGNGEVAVLNNAYRTMMSNISHLSKFDQLTNLANRSFFSGRLKRKLENHSKRQQRLAVLFIDLDNFKHVNDHFGHKTGDALLIQFSERLSDCIRATDDYMFMEKEGTIARLAGDEFAVVLSEISGSEVAASVAERLIEIFQDGFEVDNHTHNVRCSIGIALFPEDGSTVTELIQNADAAMYEAKAGGRNRYHFFTQEIADEIQKRIEIEIAIESALSDNQFALVYMPTFQAKSLKVVGAEVLLRSSHPVLQACGPEVFIPIAESNGMITQIDLWVIEQGFMNVQLFREHVDFHGVLSINISAVELHNKVFVDKVIALVDAYGIDTSKVEFEITETSFVAHDQQSIDTLKALKGLGFKLSLDDFGTGYTAFNQLIHYPVDTLKIDRSFVWAWGKGNEIDDTMLETMVRLASLYGLDTIAEGVETADQMDYLTELGCEAFQGFYFSKPIDGKHFEALVNENSVDLDDISFEPTPKPE